MSFSATDAAFEGFKVVRRHPLALVFWTLAYFVSFALFFALFGGTLATVMATAESIQKSSQPSMADLESLGQAYMGMFGLAMPLVLVFGAVLNAAIARSVLRPSEKAFGYIRFGSDELRVLAVSVALFVVMFGATILAFGLVGVAAGIVAASGQAILFVLVVLLGIAAVVALIWLALRLSLAAPITIAEKKIAIFESFALTKGKTLPLLGMAVIAFIMTLLVSLLGSIVGLPITLLTGGMDSLAAFDGQSTVEILNGAAPALIGWGGLNAILSALQLAVMYAPFSAAYRDIKGLPHE